MVVTIAGTNYSQITSMDTDTTGGAWSGQTPNEDLSSYKEGSGSMSFVMKTNGTNETIFTPTTPIDMSGTKHLRFWMLSTHGGDYTQTEIGLDDGVNTGYWVVATSSEYPGGWYQCIVDVSSTVDSGTKPTSMNAITDFNFRITLTGGKNATNFWLDNLIYCDGLTAYGDVGGSEFDFGDIYTTGISEGTGVISLFGGVYYLTGSITIGDSAGTASSDFIAKNQTVVFIDKSAYISASLYSIDVVGNATGATQRFELGEKSGTAGISGCNIICNDTTLAYEFTATDTDVDDFGLYGSTFDTHGVMDFQPDGTNLEIINANFLNGQGQIQPNTMDVTNCNFVAGGTGTDGTVLIESASHNITYSSFISNVNAVEISVATAISFDNLTFTNNTNDVYNTSGSTVTVSQTDSNASSYNAAGDIVSFETTVSIDIHIQDIDGSDIVGAQVYMQKDSPTTYNSHAANNSAGDVTFEASASVDSDTAASGWLIIRAVDEQEWHWYRYASRTSTVFTLPTEITGTADNSGSETTTLYDVAIDFEAGDIIEGDVLINETDSSWCQIKSITDSDYIVHTSLVGGTNNYWTTGDAYSIHSLVQTYDGSDTFKVPLVNNNTDGTGDVSFSYVHPGGTVVATIKVRHSPDAGTKYLPATASASFDGAYSTTIALFEDTTAA